MGKFGKQSVILDQTADRCNHRHHEQDNRSLDTTDDLLVGTGLGQLAAAAVACAANIIDLPDIAVESVRLAFRTGAVVENFSIPARQAGESDASWSLVVPGNYEDIRAELQTLQDAAVSFRYVKRESC